VAARIVEAGKYRIDEKKYIRAGGTKCPFCGSDEIEGSSVEVDSSSAWQEVGCNNCDSEWNDIYKLDDIEVTQEGNDPVDPAEKGYPMAEGK